MISRDEIIQFYTKNVHLRIPKERYSQQPLTEDGYLVCNFNPGLGDGVSVLSIPQISAEQNRNIFAAANSPHFMALTKYLRIDYDARARRVASADFKGNVNVCALVEMVDCGNGHFIQQIHRGMGLITPIKPSGLMQTQTDIKKKKVVVSFGAGSVTALQKQTIHPRAREFYAEHKETVQRFINENTDYEFVEIGNTKSGLVGVRDATGTDGYGLLSAINELYSADFHLGIHSGITNLAAAIGVKSIVMINFPDAKLVRLPHIVKSDITDIHWLYPQNVHLHMDKTDDHICPYFSYENLERAFNHEIYPYFSDKYLDLILEDVG